MQWIGVVLYKKLVCITSYKSLQPVSTAPPLMNLELRGWRNTVEIVLFEIANSMKPYPSVYHAYTSKLRPAIVLFEPTNLDEVSDRIPPTSHLFSPHGASAGPRESS